MANSKTDRNHRAAEREIVRQEVAAACKTESRIADVFARALESILEHLADSASIDLVEDDGTIARAITRHTDSRMEEVLAKYRSEHPLPLTASYGYPRVIKTGKAQFIPGVNDRIGSRLFSPAGSEFEAQLVVDGISVRSFICVPLVARGRVLGALTVLTTGKNRLLMSDDLLLFEELAELLGETLDAELRRHSRGTP